MVHYMARFLLPSAERQVSSVLFRQVPLSILSVPFEPSWRKKHSHLARGSPRLRLGVTVDRDSPLVVIPPAGTL